MYKLTHNISLTLEEVSSIELKPAVGYSDQTKLTITMKNGHSHILYQSYGYDSIDVYKLKSLLEQAIDATSRPTSES